MKDKTKYRVGKGSYFALWYLCKFDQ